MEENKKFRNHFSIVAEQMGSAATVLFVAVTGILFQNLQEITELTEKAAGSTEKIILICGAIFLILLAATGYQIMIWSKTYISIQDNSLVIERRMVQQKKNTIGIHSISNVNLERNLFEMLIGTAKVKVDTNSMSTSDKTDVKIVLKHCDAKALQTYLLRRMRAEERSISEDVPGNQACMENKLKKGSASELTADLPDILVHGFFSINLFSILVALGCIVGMVMMAANIWEHRFGSGGIVETAVTLFMMVLVFISSVRDLLKNFIAYYQFRIARQGDRIEISYGLFKKISYTIPVDKINGIRLRQTLFARLGKRYMAEMINIGMGDDAAEAKSFLLPYATKEHLKEAFDQLLPELSEELDISVKRQPKAVFAAWIMPYLTYGVTVSAVIFGTAELFPKYLTLVQDGAAILTGIVILMSISRYITAGTALSRHCLIVTNGYFQRTISFLAYEKIQYVELEQNLIARKFQIQKGTCYLLASTANRVHVIPYFSEQDVEKLRDCMLAAEMEK